ncbi:MAG: hypothetical protein K2K91_05760 [Ruminococcus sp.]|nr:hypothetical protein [Ruminococcus sp.]
MNFILVILAVLLLWGIHNIGKKNDDYLSVRQTQAVNGYFIILVFLRHFWQYIEVPGKFDHLFDAVNSGLGQMIVTTFMFYSGYGVTVSVLKKGKTYLKSFPKNRILKTMLMFDAAILLYVLINLILSIEMNPLKILTSFIGWDSVGNSNWYIFAILCMYFVTWLAFSAGEILPFKSKQIPSLIIALILTGIYMILVRKFKDGQFYNTVLCYTIGMWYACFKEKIDKLLSCGSVYLLSLIAVCAAFTASYLFRNHNLAFDQLHYLLFVLCIVLITMRVKSGNLVLEWCGKNLLGLYILQRIPMILFKRIDAVSSNTYVYCAACLAVTLILTIAFQKVVADNLAKLFQLTKKKA